MYYAKSRKRSAHRKPEVGAFLKIALGTYRIFKRGFQQ
jgi:hypothetical protein